METFEDICRQHRLKITPQRVAIYNELKDNLNHPTADAVYKQIRKVFPSISFDTVNRTLILFSRIGIIQTMECSGQGRQYDPNTKTHHHLKCTQCGVIKDFHYNSFDDLDIPKQLKKEFKVINKQVVFTGICQQCNKN